MHKHRETRREERDLDPKPSFAPSIRILRIQNTGEGGIRSSHTQHSTHTHVCLDQLNMHEEERGAGRPKAAERDVPPGHGPGVDLDHPKTTIQKKCGLPM